MMNGQRERNKMKTYTYHDHNEDLILEQFPDVKHVHIFDESDGILLKNRKILAFLSALRKAGL